MVKTRIQTSEILETERQTVIFCIKSASQECVSHAVTGPLLYTPGLAPRAFTPKTATDKPEKKAKHIHVREVRLEETYSLHACAMQRKAF